MKKLSWWELAISFFSLLIIATTTYLSIRVFLDINRTGSELIESKLELKRVTYEASKVPFEEQKKALEADRILFLEDVLHSKRAFLPIIVSIAALLIASTFQLIAFLASQFRQKSCVGLWHGIHYRDGSDDDRPEYKLFFRNQSYKPNAIVELYLRDNNAKFIEGIGYRDRIELPIQIEPWSARLISFRIEKQDDSQFKDILFIDVEGREFICDRKAKGDKWEKTSLHRESRRSNHRSSKR